MVSVIIPTFNDTRFLLEVLTVLEQVEEVSEIVVVDDGSDDEESLHVLARLSRAPTTPVSPTILTGNAADASSVKVITHPQNRGKAAALKTGFLDSHGDPIVFMDADLRGLHPSHVRDLLAPVLGGDLDIAIGVRGGGLDRLARCLSFFRLIGGERAIRRFVLQDNLDLFDTTPGFGIELTMNQRFFGRCRVGFVELAGLNHRLKMGKYGWIKGLVGELKMVRQIIHAVGAREVAKQIRMAYRLPYLTS